MIGIPLGIVAALKQNTLFDYASLLFSTIGVAVPTFVTGLLVIMVFGTALDWISITNNDWSTWRPYIAPGVVLGMATMSFITRLTRSTVLEIKRQDYIRTARAKGLSERMVISRHMLRNNMIPIATLIGPALVDLATGSVITEAIFEVPGVGGYFVTSIFQRDYSMIMGTTLIYATLIVFANMHGRPELWPARPACAQPELRSTRTAEPLNCWNPLNPTGEVSPCHRHSGSDPHVPVESHRGAGPRAASRLRCCICPIALRCWPI